MFETGLKDDRKMLVSTRLIQAQLNPPREDLAGYTRLEVTHKHEPLKELISSEFSIN
jgi:hypothetical protein